MIELIELGNGGQPVFQGLKVKLQNTNETSLYLALFGGNLDQNYFGNLYHDQEYKKYISLTESYLNKTAIINPATLKIKVQTDLNRLGFIVDDIQIKITDTVYIDIYINSNLHQFTYTNQTDDLIYKVVGRAA